MEQGKDYLENLPYSSPKRFDILRYAARGYSYLEIARMCNKSYQTIKNEIYRVQHQAGAKNIAHLIHLAHEAGIL